MCKRIFQIVMKVPLGERPGNMRWQEDNGLLNGFLEIMGHENPFSGMLESEGRIRIEGTLVTLIRNIPFTAEGKLEEGHLSMTLTEIRHKYSLEGVEITENEEIL